MMRQINVRRQLTSAAAIALAFAAGFAAQAAFAQLSYQDADELINDPALGRPNVQPVEAFNSVLPPVDNDNLWNYRDFGVGAPSFPTVYQSGVSENSPMLTQTLTGLTPSQSYDVYAVYWTDEDENWTINTGTSPGSLNFYSWTGDAGNQTVPGSTPGLPAATAVWAVPPPTTKEGTVFTERAADPLVMLLGYAGTASANASGQLDVFIDDNPNAGGVRRTWFDGVAYVPAGPGLNIAATATLDRATGAVTLNNPTTQNLEIKAYRIESGTSGALNATTWSTIASGNASWSVISPGDPAAAPHTNMLSEDGGGTTVTLASGGGSLSFGNVWHKTPFDHVLVYLTLADDSLAVLAANAIGPDIVNGDFDGNELVDLADFQTLLNGLHMPPFPPLFTRVETYRMGEMTGDAVINISDWIAFRNAFNAANGAGAFEAMVALVPEPSTLALAVGAGVLASFGRRRRAVVAACALVMCCVLTSTSSAATLLKVDVNSRTLEVNPPVPEGTDTVAGFSAYTLTGTGPQAMSSNTVDGYTISLTAVNSAGVATGVMDDRDRGLPNATPSLNQLYDDFIFANVGQTGEGGGLDVSINSGGALMPNTQYGVSIYSFDTDSNGLRTADWLDGNSSNVVAFSTSFDGVNDPTTDDQYKFNGVFRTDSSGNLLLRARETAPASHGVFINGLEISDELPPPPVELTLRVNTTTGAVSIVNEQSVSIDLSYYEIRSAAGSLNLAGWTSLDDAEGGDPLGTGWDEVPASNANVLSEVNLQSLTSFAPGHSVSLGNAFNIGGTQDIQLTYLAGPGGVDGDYNGNGTVDAADYVVWRKNLGTTTTLPNDSTPGMVTQEDYTVWRANFGEEGAAATAPRTGIVDYVSGAGASLAASSAVPEPSVGVLLAAALIAIAAGRTSGRRAAVRLP